MDQTGASIPSKPNGLEDFDSIVAKHPLAIAFQQQASTIKKSRSILIVQPEHLPNNLLCTTLAGDEKISQPYAFADDAAGTFLVFYHLGRKLAGHTGIVHGGIAGVILDECMGRACFPRLPGKIAVTATLNLEYKSPIPVDSVIMIYAETKKVEGRKAFVEATVKDAVDDRDLVKATALYIEPRWAAEMTPVV